MANFDALIGQLLGHHHSEHVLITGGTMTGALKITPTANSTTTFQIFKQDGTTNVLTVDTTNGRVGIGTTSPLEKLHVYGSTGNILSSVQSGTKAFTTYTDSASDIAQYWTTGSALRFGTSTTGVDPTGFSEKVRITTDGNVGIGTTTPGAKLDIRNSESGYINSILIGKASHSVGDYENIGFADGSTVYSGISGGADGFGSFGLDVSGSSFLKFKTGNLLGSATEWMRITSGGNVGIGTTSPTNLLSLGGNSARIFWMERGTVAATQGFGLTVEAGGATVGSTDKTGGNLVLKSGLATGTGSSDVIVQAHPAGSTGTVDTTATEVFRVKGSGSIVVPVTITAVGTTGNQTINKAAGRVNIAAAGTTVTVTNSLVTANSIVLAVAATADATARVTNVVPAAGSFVINTVATTAETAFNFLVIS